MNREEAIAVLGLSSAFTALDLKTAYRQQVLQWHPDRNKEANAGARFQRIKEAYDLLQAPETTRTAVPSFRESGGPALALSLSVPLEILVNGGTVPMAYDGKTCDLVIPIGTTPGTRLRVPGGAPDTRDLVIFVEAEVHPLFDVRGIDLAVEIEIPASTEDLEVEMPSLRGDTFVLPVAPPVQSGAYLRYEGRGLRPGGDLYVFIRRMGALAAPPKQPGVLDTVLRSIGPRSPSQKPRSQPRPPRRS